MNSRFKEIENELALLNNSTEASEVELLSNRFDDELLGKERFCDEGLNLILSILSSRRYDDIPGIASFIVGLYMQFEKLSDNQRKDIFEVINSNFCYYNDENLCLAVTDIVVRKYDYDQALRFVNSNNGISTENGKYAINVALDVLNMNSKQKL